MYSYFSPPASFDEVTCNATSPERSKSLLLQQQLRASEATMLLVDQLRAMLIRETHYTAEHSVSPAAISTSSIPAQHGEWRGKICEWSYRVIDHFCYDREVVSIAMDYFDRFLIKSCCGSDAQQESTVMASRTYQLSAMTSLYVAMKLHAEAGVDSPDLQNGGYSSMSIYRKRRLKIQSYVELSRGQFAANDLLDMETVLLDTLEWKINPVTPMCFVSYMLRLFPQAAMVPSCAAMPHLDLVLHVLHELSRYLTELAICLPDVSLLGTRRKSYPPSSIAYASILISMDMLTAVALPMGMRRSFLEVMGTLSMEATGERDAPLHPLDEDVRFLQRRIRNAFLPEMILDQAGAESGPGAQQHPISIARDAGLLNMNALYASYEDDEDEQIHDDDSIAMSSMQDAAMRETEYCHRQSATSVMQDIAHHIVDPLDTSNDSPVCVSKLVSSTGKSKTFRHGRSHACNPPL